MRLQTLESLNKKSKGSWVVIYFISVPLTEENPMIRFWFNRKISQVYMYIAFWKQWDINLNIMMAMIKATNKNYILEVHNQV